MPKIVDHEKYRRELLDRSFDLFAERGVSSVSMREIAEALGVSTGTLYHYFPDKDSLFAQLVQTKSERDALIMVAEASVGKTPRERMEILLRYIDQHEAYFTNRVLVGLDYVRLHRSMTDAAREPIRMGAQTFYEGIVYLFGGEDPALVTRVYSLIIGLLTSRLLTGDRTPMVAAIDGVERWLFSKPMNDSVTEIVPVQPSESSTE
jgi:AcrR family transcriptional regulator